MRRRLALLLSAAALIAGPSQAAEGHLEGKLANGATWVFDTPAQWNGTVVLYSHGFAMGPANRASNASGAVVREALLARGYALAGSSFRTTGWALDDAPKDQIETLDVFAATVGKPRRTLAWGHSMGGLVTVALVERRPDRIDGALPLCGSLSGGVGMMNMALDAAFTFKTLLAPEMRIVGITDDLGILKEAAAVIAEARKTPEGRARLALVATLAELPPWTDAQSPEPAASVPKAQLDQLIAALARGVFFPRSDQEKRAGGVVSWNTGVDYARQLKLTGRQAFVEAFYREANLDLKADLARLRAAPRNAGDAKAVAYFRENYSPTGVITRPVLTLHTTNDPATMVTTEAAYRDAVAGAGRSALLRQVYTHRSGHCAFTPGEEVAALLALDQRVSTGRWVDLSPAALNASAAALDLPAGATDHGGATGPSAFTTFEPAPFLRPCIGNRPCAGEPSRR